MQSPLDRPPSGIRARQRLCRTVSQPSSRSTRRTIPCEIACSFGNPFSRRRAVMSASVVSSDMVPRSMIYARRRSCQVPVVAILPRRAQFMARIVVGRGCRPEPRRMESESPERQAHTVSSSGGTAPYRTSPPKTCIPDSQFAPCDAPPSDGHHRQREPTPRQTRIKLHCQVLPTGRRPHADAPRSACCTRCRSGRDRRVSSCPAPAVRHRHARQHAPTW